MAAGDDQTDGLFEMDGLGEKVHVIKKIDVIKKSDVIEKARDTEKAHDIEEKHDTEKYGDIEKYHEIDTNEEIEALKDRKAHENIQSKQDITTRVEDAIKRLCDDLDATYTNLFDQRTLQNLDFETRLRKRIVVGGTFACGIWEPGEDIHLLFLSNNSAEIFWPYLKENLHLHKHTQVPKKRETGTIDLSSPLLSRVVDKSRCCLPTFIALRRRTQAHCRFYLHYVEVPMSFAVDRIVKEKIPYHTGRRAAFPACNNIKLINDMLEISHDTTTFLTADFAGFIRLLNILRDWAKSYGLIGSRVGFLDADAFMWLAREVIKEDCSPYSGSQCTDMEHLLETAFNKLKNYFDDTSDPDRLCPKLEGLIDPLSFEVKQAFEVALSRTLERPLDGILLCKEQKDPLRDFADDFDFFFNVQSHSYHDIIEDRDEFQNVHLPKCLQEAVRFLHNDERYHWGKFSTRIWPTPFVTTALEGKQTYIIGIKLEYPYSLEMFQSEAEHVQKEIMNYALEYNRNHNVIHVYIVTKNHIKNLVSGNYDLEEDMAPGDPPPSPRFYNPSGYSPNTPGKKARPFRDAPSAIARLMFDPTYRRYEFEVGYVDRFEEELQWVPLDHWKDRVTEDEDWIPQHRVRQLRLASDKKVVWDREKRFDML